MPDRMPNRMSEDMSDRMPEDVPVRTCINVMVGITRSKVIFPAIHHPSLPSFLGPHLDIGHDLGIDVVPGLLPELSAAPIIE